MRFSPNVERVSFAHHRIGRHGKAGCRPTPDDAAQRYVGIPCRRSPAGMKEARVTRTSAILLLASLMIGCGSPDPRLTIVGLEHRPFRPPELVLRLDLPRPLRRGLLRGVPLSFRLDLQLDGRNVVHWRELRYLPLSRQYQLREPATQYSRSYDSRAAALAALERWTLPSVASKGEITARVRLDSTRLPAPLVLPAVFDSDWRLDSGTTRWPVQVPQSAPAAAADPSAGVQRARPHRFGYAFAVAQPTRRVPSALRRACDGVG